MPLALYIERGLRQLELKEQAYVGTESILSLCGQLIDIVHQRARSKRLVQASAIWTVSNGGMGRFSLQNFRRQHELIAPEMRRKGGESAASG